MKNFPQILLCCIIVFCFNACSLLQPIVHVTAYYPARAYATLVAEIPAGTKYIGTVKIVPGDNAFRISFKKEEIMNKLLEEAAKVGADYVHIKSIEKTNKDFFFDIVYSDGYTIMGEMYRLQF